MREVLDLRGLDGEKTECWRFTKGGFFFPFGKRSWCKQGDSGTIAGKSQPEPDSQGMLCRRRRTPAQMNVNSGRQEGPSDSELDLTCSGTSPCLVHVPCTLF